MQTEPSASLVTHSLLVTFFTNRSCACSVLRRKSRATNHTSVGRLTSSTNHEPLITSARTWLITSLITRTLITRSVAVLIITMMPAPTTAPTTPVAPATPYRMKRHRTKEYTKLMNSRRWRRLRAAYLSAHPVCEDCEQQGRTTIATEVHHIRPIESVAGRPVDMQELAFNPCNLRALCKACHIEAHRVLHSNSLSSSKERAQAELSAFASAYLSE